MDNKTKDFKKGNIFFRVLPFFEDSRRVLLIAIIWTFVILFLTGLPGDSFPKTSKWLDIFQVDKLIHLGMFIPFTLFWLLFLKLRKMPNTNAMIIASIIGIIYGILTEVLQFYVFIGRSANFPDALADAIGVVFGVLIFNIIPWQRQEK